MDDITFMSAGTRNAGALGLHYGAFLPTILRLMSPIDVPVPDLTFHSQGTDDQKFEWLFPTLQMKIVGAWK